MEQQKEWHQRIESSLYAIETKQLILSTSSINTLEIFLTSTLNFQEILPRRIKKHVGI